MQDVVRSQLFVCAHDRYQPDISSKRDAFAHVKQLMIAPVDGGLFNWLFLLPAMLQCTSVTAMHIVRWQERIMHPSHRCASHDAQDLTKAFLQSKHASLDAKLLVVPFKGLLQVFPKDACTLVSRQAEHGAFDVDLSLSV